MLNSILAGSRTEGGSVSAYQSYGEEGETAPSLDITLNPSALQKRQRSWGFPCPLLKLHEVVVDAADQTFVVLRPLAS